MIIIALKITKVRSKDRLDSDTNLKPIFFFCRTQVTKGGSMVIELKLWVVALAATLIFLGGYFLGKLARAKPHCSGRLIIDEKGEKERWSFMIDDDIDEIREKPFIFLEIDRRA